MEIKEDTTDEMNKKTKAGNKSLRSLIIVGIIIIVIFGTFVGVKLTKEKEEIVIDNEKSVVFVSSDDCIYCIQVKEILDKVVPKYNDIKLVNANISNMDESQLEELLKLYKVKYTPTLIFLEGGEVVNVIEGLTKDSEDKVLEAFEELRNYNE